MRIVVDQLPDTCEKCLFCGDTEIFTNEYNNKGIKCKCSLTKEVNEDGRWRINEKCPLLPLEDNIELSMRFGNSYDGKYCRLKASIDGISIASCEEDVNWSFR